MIFRKIKRSIPVELAIKSYHSIAIMALVLVISACHPHPGGLAIPTSCLPFPAFFEKAATRDDLKGTMKTLADLDMQAMGKKYPARMAIMMRRPDVLRMETIPVIGPPDFMLSVSDNRLRVFLPAKGEFYEGNVSQHLSRFIPLTIDIRDAIAVMMGAIPPLGAGDCVAPVKTEDDLSQVDVLSGTGNLRMSLWLKGPEQVLHSLKAFGGSAKGDYSVEFSDYGQTNGIAMPEKIVIRMAGSAGIKQTLTVHYSDLEWSDEGDDSAFELTVPTGIKPIKLTDMTN